MKPNLFSKLTEITTTKKTLKTIVFSIVGISFSAMLICFIVFTTKLSSLSENIYIVNQTTGDVSQASRVDIDQIRPIEARAHARKFIELFFNINKLNVTQQLTQAYDLGGNTIHKLYKSLETKNWYKKIRQYNIVQYAEIKSITMTSENYPYTIKALFLVNIESDVSRPTVYDIEFDFIIRNNSGDRSEANPHNMFIDNIDIINWQQITTDNN